MPRGIGTPFTDCNTQLDIQVENQPRASDIDSTRLIPKLMFLATQHSGRLLLFLNHLVPLLTNGSAKILTEQQKQATSAGKSFGISLVLPGQCPSWKVTWTMSYQNNVLPGQYPKWKETKTMSCQDNIWVTQTISTWTMSKLKCNLDHVCPHNVPPEQCLPRQCYARTMSAVKADPNNILPGQTPSWCPSWDFFVGWEVTQTMSAWIMSAWTMSCQDNVQGGR